MFLFIPPESVRNLALNGKAMGTAGGTDANNVGTLGPGGTKATYLRFVLSKPPSLVGPHQHLQPRNKSSGRVWDSLCALAHQTSLDVCFTMSGRLSALRLLGLCDAVSRGLGSIAAHANRASLYAGKGGTLVDVGIARLMPATTAAASAKPPPALHTWFSRVVDSRLAVMRHELTDSLSEQMQGLETRLETSLQKYIDERLGEIRVDMRQEITNMVDVEGERISIEVQDLVQEELNQVEETLRERIENSSLSLHFGP
ncbi:uncharacterized protein BCR38DRAFT_406983 [Pseudomassariella vexata]|uniref:Uncharacterized protein n=1 Tax=Pseudomassariella vexata TaxID=1141098 RepID=A0A1Y2ECI3_9PEZI|nr:uncharacterized protein BCR38DRAFT_406983 [Pseudomassariella vexata]ORY69117.1 hypothetical protein BCR38DRAFT_406983 [Pseudomassariella vexata]